MQHSSKCPFCNFQDDTVVIYRDNECFALVSANPINEFHVLVIPKEHFENMIDLPPDLLSHLALVTQKLSRAVRATCQPTAIIHLSDDDIEKTGYNLVPHFKIHIIPRFSNDQVVINWNRKGDPGLGVRAETASKIKKNLE